MEAASLRTISPARALAGAPARTSARLFALGVIGPLDTRSLSRGCLPWPSTHSQRKNPDPTRQAGEGWGGGELKGLSCCVPLPVPPAQAGEGTMWHCLSQSARARHHVRGCHFVTCPRISPGQFASV